MGPAEIVEIAFLALQLLPGVEPPAHQLQETPRGSLHVGRCIVRRGKTLAEQVCMQLDEFGELVAASAGDLAQVGRNLAHRVEHAQTRERVFQSFAEILAPHYRDVERDVLSHGKPRPSHSLGKLAQHKSQVGSLAQGTLGGDTVNLLRVERNVIPLGTDDKVLGFDQLAHRTVQLPGELDHPGPVVGIAYRSVVISGKSRGFGIEYQVHNLRRYIGVFRPFQTKIRLSPTKGKRVRQKLSTNPRMPRPGEKTSGFFEKVPLQNHLIIRL